MFKKYIWLPTMLLILALVLAACPATAPETASSDAGSADTSSEAAMDDGVCGPASDGAYAGVDPRDTTFVW
ncbi:hypothetical protein KFU94_54910 [Chloroflexi bacterium TSY]|nr:hypothetical protein [Chloroflexi bacterium TSY]